MWLAHSIKKLARELAGIDIRRLHNVPSLSFLGLNSIPFESVIDVGANNGGFAKIATRIFPRAKLVCFEPLQEPRTELAHWARRRGIPLVIEPLALGDQSGPLKMYEHVDHSTSSSLLPTTKSASEIFPETQNQREIVAEVTTLDQWAATHHHLVKSPVLLKLDVQGYEMKVLRGAVEFLKAVDTCIVEVSVRPLYEGQPKFIELAKALDDAGLSYIGNLEQHHDRSGTPIFLDAVFRRSLAAKLQIDGNNFSNIR